jgi:hypothetical protein
MLLELLLQQPELSLHHAVLRVRRRRLLQILLSAVDVAELGAALAAAKQRL